MKIYTPIGSKDRLFEMFENVNKIKLNEDMNSILENNTVLEMSFDKLNSGNLNVKNKNTQTNDNETFVELDCTDERNNVIKFIFKLTAREGDQEGVFGIDSVTMTNFKYQDVSGGGNIEVDENGLKQFNAERSEDLFGIVSDYADFDTQEPEIDETYMEVIKKIDSYPFGGTPRTMQTSKAYADEKSTNPKLRVNAPELERVVDEALITTPYSINISDEKRKTILKAVDSLKKKMGSGYRNFNSKEINAEIQKMKNLRLADVDEEFIGANNQQKTGIDGLSDDKKKIVYIPEQLPDLIVPIHRR